MVAYSKTFSCPPHHVPLSRQGYPLAVAAAGRRHVLVGEQLRGEAVDVRQHQARVPAAGVVLFRVVFVGFVKNLEANMKAMFNNVCRKRKKS